jgi:glycosyltransferase involved in cell wall biosynthesis
MRENHNLHSFAVLAYKESPYLEECVLSLISQTVRSRIVIYTSTPSQNVIDISKKYEIPLVINKYHQGIASDWNFAYNSCESEYVTLVHDDDIYLPRYNESCFSAIDKIKTGDSLIIFTWYNDLLGKKESIFNINLMIKKFLLLPCLIRSDIRRHFLKMAILSVGNPIPCPSVMYHKSQIGTFNFSKTFTCNMDWDAWLRLSEKRGSFVFVNSKLLLHRIYERSQTSQQIDNKGRRNEDLLIFKRLWPEPVAKLLLALYSLSYRMNNAR